MRCLQSVALQTYKMVEIIISDDSPDEDIKVAIEPLQNSLNIRYYHNQPSLKSPRNWNAALDKAGGDFVMLMHQDDWFEDATALQQFLNVFEQQPQTDFVFCQNTAIDETGKKTILQARPYLLKEMAEKPDHLLLAQVIGPPSNTMLRKKVITRYDERFIWLVDVDYYVRLLKEGHRYFYIPKHLVSIGLHEDQTTVFCRTHADIIFKENIWFAGKLGPKAFNDILIFDYYWRLLRNYKIRSIVDITANGVAASEVPVIINYMLERQQHFSLKLLQNGIFSKVMMGLSYAIWKTKKDVA